MNSTEEELNEKYATKSAHCNRKTLLPYEYEFTCISCNHNVIKQKRELSKVQRKKFSFINRIKFAEHKLFCISVEVYKVYERIDFSEIFEVLATLKRIEIKQFPN